MKKNRSNQSWLTSHPPSFRMDSCYTNGDLFIPSSVVRTFQNLWSSPREAALRKQYYQQMNLDRNIVEQEQRRVETESNAQHGLPSQSLNRLFSDKEPPAFFLNELMDFEYYRVTGSLVIPCNSFLEIHVDGAANLSNPKSLSMSAIGLSISPAWCQKIPPLKKLQAAGDALHLSPYLTAIRLNPYFTANADSYKCCGISLTTVKDAPNGA